MQVAPSWSNLNQSLWCSFTTFSGVPLQVGLPMGYW